MKSPFIPNHVYKRSGIHDEYGGNRQSGISDSAQTPYIFIFSGKTGAQYGYKDGWDNPKVFTYTGEGQVGDMKFTKGNLALQQHMQNGKRVFLFEYETKAFVKFISELEFFDSDFEVAPDRTGTLRTAIKFFFKRVGVRLPVKPQELTSTLWSEEDLFTYPTNIPSVTERQGLVTSRIGQGAYRKRVIHRWEYKCAVTSFDKLNVLIASHIVPWASATNEERLDIHNGILLTPHYDALFDQHLISFENSGKIRLSDQIDMKAYLKIGITGKEAIPNFSEYNQRYLIRHREKFESL